MSLKKKINEAAAARNNWFYSLFLFTCRLRDAVHLY